MPTRPDKFMSWLRERKTGWREERKTRRRTKNNSVLLSNSPFSSWLADRKASWRESRRKRDRPEEDKATRGTGTTSRQRTRRLPATFDDRMQELAAYKREHGDCNVPQTQGPLGKWVNRQRTNRRKGKLSEDRVLRLADLGFNWISARKTHQLQEQMILQAGLQASKLEAGTGRTSNSEVVTVGTSSDSLGNDEIGAAWLMNDNLHKCLEKLANHCQETNNLVFVDAFDRLRAVGSDWTVIREMIVQSTDGSWDAEPWCIPINSDKMLIPVWTLRTRPTRIPHFVALVRFRDQKTGKWVFALVDSFAPQGYHLDEINSLLRDNSTLGCPEDMMNGDPNGTAHDNASRIELIPCRDQAGTECGYRVILHLYFAMKSNTLEEYANKIRKLNSIDKIELNVHVRRWVMGVLSDDWDGTMPLWISNITGTDS